LKEKKNDTNLGQVQRNGAVNELEQLKKGDNIRVRKGKVQTATKKAEDAVGKAQKFFDELKLKGGASPGSMWWMERELSEAKKYLPQSKQRYSDRLEINDYPQAARYKAMKNSTLNDIIEYSGAAITAKGQHIPTGKNPPTGIEKLYLFIEGPDKNSVDLAKIELKRILEESSILAHREAATRRYNVLQ